MIKENRDHQINILHLLDMAGGSSIQSHFYEKFGYGKSWVLYHKKPKINAVVEYYKEAKPFPTVRSIVNHSSMYATCCAVYYRDI